MHRRSTLSCVTLSVNLSTTSWSATAGCTYRSWYVAMSSVDTRPNKFPTDIKDRAVRTSS